MIKFISHNLILTEIQNWDTEALVELLKASSEPQRPTEAESICNLSYNI